MKHYFTAVLFLTFSSYSFAQTPSPSPTLAPQQARIIDFGSSLERYEKQDKRKSHDKQQNVPDKQKGTEPDNDDVIKVKTDLVINDVLVTDHKANVIAGLKKEDFIITENNAPQTIEIFSPGESTAIPRSIVLILDGEGPLGPYLKNSFAAAKALVEKLNPNDKMAIVTADLKLRLDFTRDKTLLKKTLDSLDSLDKTDTTLVWAGRSFESLLAVLNEMFNEEDSRPVVIFQGGGNGIIWLKPDKDAPYPVSQSLREDAGMKYVGGEKAMRKIGFSEVKEAIESSRATIYSVIPGIRFFGLSEKERMTRGKISWENMCAFYGMKNDLPPTMKKMFEDREANIRTAGQAAMYRIADLSGGNTGFIEKPDDAQEIYSEIFTIIKSRYVLGYYPANKMQEAKARNVTVQVRNHPEYLITTRKTYLLQ